MMRELILFEFIEGARKEYVYGRVVVAEVSSGLMSDRAKQSQNGYGMNFKR